MKDNAARAMEAARERDAEITRLGHIAAALEWDQETYMPDAATGERAAQIALLAGLHHDKASSSEWGGLLADLDAAAEGEVDRAFLREAHKRWEKKTKVPKDLAVELARSASLAQSAWAKARKENDFSAFAPHLEGLLGLQRRYAEAVDPEADAYDVLLDEYEPGATGAEVAEVFDGLAAGLDRLLSAIRGGTPPRADFLARSYDVGKQDAFGRRIHEWMGFDTNRGRLDLSVHPFTTSLGADDVRITTRYEASNVLSGLFSNIHEAGHGLYEQGYARDIRGSLLADGASLGIHESQSRFWENVLGRSRAFWERWYHEFRALFPGNLDGVDAQAFYRAVNLVEPSLIRVDADEVTYSYHIIIRFRLERALLSGDLPVADLPGAWNDAYSHLLGVSVPDDADGCLQDVHWSAGLFGYFPTYALGNLYAAQFTRAMESAVGPLESRMEDDDASAILGWLRQNIHAHGRTFLPGELCRKVTGAPLDPRHFLEYLEGKYAGVYGF